MTNERIIRRNKCKICSCCSFGNESTNEYRCEKYLKLFLIDLQNKLDDENMIEEHFANSIFNDDDYINQSSCNGLTLMHINLLGERRCSTEDEPDNEDHTFYPLYEESVGTHVCKILLKHGASPNGNIIYEMRPLHIAIRRQWKEVTRMLLETGANPNIPEKDMYASRPIDIAVISDEPDTIELLHIYGASLDGMKSMFYLPPLTESFIRGYFDVFKTLLELGAKPLLDLDRSTFRTFGTKLFDGGSEGRKKFIQLMYEHGGDIERIFKLHAIRIEANGIDQHEPRLEFVCDPICISEIDPMVFRKWICESRSLKAICRLTIRRYLFNHFNDGFKRLLILRNQTELNNHLYKYIMFK